MCRHDRCGRSARISSQTYKVVRPRTGGFWASSKLLLGIRTSTFSSTDLCFGVENQEGRGLMEGSHGAVSWSAALREVSRLDLEKKTPINLDRRASFISSSAFQTLYVFYEVSNNSSSFTQKLVEFFFCMCCCSSV